MVSADADPVITLALASPIMRTAFALKAAFTSLTEIIDDPETAAIGIEAPSPVMRS